jgi:hypothetical protein
MDKDWDVLLILDACRYDEFESASDIQGQLSTVVSAGCNTSQFLAANFDGRRLDDTVLVTARPHFEDIDSQFYRKKFLYEKTEVPFPELAPDMEIVPPSVVADNVVKTAQQYPNKRIVAHFLKPHAPFTGEEGREIFDPELLYSDRLKAGEISPEEAKSAYRENIEQTMPHIRRVLEEVQGKKVLTSDHGEMFGTSGVYGHAARYPSWDPESIRKSDHRSGDRFDRVYAKELAEVPWLVVEGEDRREVISGDVTETDEDKDSELAKEQLRHLGYVT